MEKVIGIGEYTVSNNETDTIKTFALASCVAVTAYSQTRKAGGMIHVALPSPLENDPKDRPGYYATTGIPLLIDRLCRESGCLKGELTVQIYGGADSIYRNDIFKIGKRNIVAVTNTLSELNLKVNKSEIGGTCSRTIEMDLETGNINVHSQPIRI